MADSSKPKKKRGTDMLMEKRAIHDMETMLQSIVDSDSRCYDISKALVEYGISDIGISHHMISFVLTLLTEKLNALCHKRPSKLSDFGFSPMEISKLCSSKADESSSLSGGSSDGWGTQTRQCPRIPDIEMRISQVEEIISRAIVSEARYKKYARQLVISGVSTQGDIYKMLLSVFNLAIESISQICTTNPKKLCDFGFNSDEIDMMVQHFRIPEFVDSNGRIMPITSNDLERIIIDVETLIRPVIASDPRCKKYARQMAISGINTHGKRSSI